MNENPSHPALRVWLDLLCLCLLGMIALGGVTRLTQSGLSIVKWEPIIGVRYPSSDSEWQERFDAYRAATGQAAALFPDMDVAQFKRLFFWEYLHRLAGRAIGLVFLIPGLVFLARRFLHRRLAWQLAGALLLGGLQGAVGWIMVASGLNPEATRVSHIKLALHLSLAFTLLGYLWWLRLGLAPEPRRWAGPREIRRGARAFLFVLIVQIVYGAFTAGLRAGYIYNTFPTMNGLWIPPDAIPDQVSWRDLVDNPVTVQLVHRLLGWVLAIGAFTLWIYSQAFGLTGRQRAALRAVFGLTWLQFGLGVATLLLHVPVALGVAHQVNAALLLLAALTLVKSLRAPAGAG